MSLKDEVLIEIEKIDELIDTYNDLLKKVKTQRPDIVEIAALASIVQSFYTGIENILNRIAKKEKIVITNKSSWHKELLKEMVAKGVISSGLWLDFLDEFRAIRHVFVHNYSHFYDWDEMENIVLKTEEAWRQSKEEISIYIDKRE